MMQDPYNILFLCTGNSARSIMAEALMNHKGSPNFKAFSAGSHPTGFVRPEALEQLEIAGIEAKGLRSKDWEEFTGPDAPKLHLVITVCDNAASEACPIWPGQPMTAHWGVPDPAISKGTYEEVKKAFHEAYLTLDRRISLLLCLPLEKLDKLALKTEIDQIGKA